MKRGFIYDTDLCVDCRACVAACTLENGFQPLTRVVYSWNDNAIPGLPVINLSLACNHCDNPTCLTGCPAKAYSKDESGNVIHYQEKCMGCRYCTWRCPYNAPKINITGGYIEKCHFCFERAAEGVNPACVTACPTGAIKIIKQDEFPERNIAWFPETGLNPKVIIENAGKKRMPEIVPATDSVEITYKAGITLGKKIKEEWSLITFSILVMLSASGMISSWFTGDNGNAMVYALLPALAVILSFVHLGVKRRAWRAPLNIFYSPLSREIVSVGLFALLAALDFLIPGFLPGWMTPAVALISLITIDLVYLSVDRSTRLFLHSGQTFFSAVLAFSFFTGSITAFLVFTMLSAASIAYRYRNMSEDKLATSLFYFRAASLPLVLLLLYFENNYFFIIATVIFIAGVLTDRILFYYDFKPVNIKEEIAENLRDEHEKERNKQRQNANIP